ncbi:hypothetical protein E2C01_046767 [Portunus trituberculatus]|uniref:Uncharacterized protein n=1 Tax=Portunus trituberculatus TaxID=210409 RepID=A0A5B7G723_PORTR|nr:hypothetical protein [Portunus trituberculatus]
MGDTHHLVEESAPGVHRVHRADPGIPEGHAAEIAHYLAVLNGLKQRARVSSEDMSRSRSQDTHPGVLPRVAVDVKRSQLFKIAVTDP